MSWTFRSLFCLVLLAPPVCFAQPLAAASAVCPGDEEFELAARAFKRKSGSGTLEERKEALEKLLATGEDDALAVLAEALGKLAVKRAADEGEVARLTLEVQNKRRLIADLERRVDRDRDLKESLSKQRTSLVEIEQKLIRRKASHSGAAPWYEHLRAASAAYAPQCGSSPRKKLEKSLWKTLDGENSMDKRRGAVDALGAFGSAGTAISFQKSLAGFMKQRASLQRKLPKQMGDVRDLEQRIQEEARRTGGRSSYGAQYERVVSEAKATQEQIGDLGRLCEAMLRAGGEALAREDDAQRAKSISTLFKSQKKGKDGTRRFTLRLLGSAGLGEVRDRMLAMLEGELDPLVRATLIDALALGAQGEQAQAVETYLIEHGLVDPTWLVKGRSARALAALRSKRAIPHLIERLAKEKGRSLDEMEAALGDLTGLDFHGNATLWERWWKENGEGYEVPSLEEVATAQAERERESRGGTGFFGISTDSNRVLFVVDLSGSMEFAMIPRDNPEDDIGGGRSPDMPREGEHSRLEEAKLALVSAIGGMGRDGVFNMIFYAADVWSWKPALQSMTDGNVAEALEEVAALDAVGGTNIYGALRAALDMAGAQTTDNWEEPAVDTIFFLSDGRASFGITTDPDEILAFVRERNASAGITIHTIGLSGAQDAYLLGRLAEENGGIYVAR